MPTIKLNIFFLLNMLMFLGVASFSQLNAFDRFHRGHHPGDQHFGHADPKHHGAVKHQGDSTHHTGHTFEGDVYGR